MNRPPILVAISDQLSVKEFGELPGADGFELRVKALPDSVWLKAAICEADALWASLRLPVTREFLDGAPSLRVILTNSTGTDHLDLDAIAERGIDLITLRHDTAFLSTITPTAELAFALLLACSRRLPECIEATRQGDWARHRLGGNQLNGKTLGIVGIGRLGRIVAEYARAFRMRILGCDPYVSDMPEGVAKVDMPTLLAQSDLISLHVHLTDETRGLIGVSQFRQMKRGAILVNTSRGGLIDEAALIEAMEAGIVQAAGLDVIDGEWCKEKRDHPLIAYSRRNPRLLITPHTGGACPEAGRLTSAHSMKKLAAYFGF